MGESEIYQHYFIHNQYRVDPNIFNLLLKMYNFWMFLRKWSVNTDRIVATSAIIMVIELLCSTVFEIISRHINLGRNFSGRSRLFQDVNVTTFFDNWKHICRNLDEKIVTIHYIIFVRIRSHPLFYTETEFLTINHI